MRWCFPHHFVEARDDRHVLYLQPGSRGKHMGHEQDYLVRWASSDPPRDHVWEAHHVLWLLRLGEAHALGLFWNADWQFRGWYVNLQAPTRRHGNRFDTTDLALDVSVEADGTWRWQDEDDFAEEQELGILDAAAAAELRAEGERVIAAKPWPTGWEDWRPPPEWGPLPLPVDWHVV
ncbi:MAG TPA: DUF402 domain-containing protein [Gaiellaceae bacterium]